MADSLRARLAAGGTAFGVMAFEFFTPGLAPTLARAGADFVIIDMEHSGIGIETVKAQCAFARGAGIVPLVRVPAGIYHLIAPVLDEGARGIMAPMVQSVAEAQALVDACRYRPLGRRGLCFSVAHDGYSAGDPAAKILAANDEILTIALIESEPGVAQAAAIAELAGIDMLWLGHFDLSDSLGVPGRFEDRNYLAAAARLRDAALAAGKPIGWLAANAEQARAALAAGFRCICIGHEVMLLRDAVAAAIAGAKQPADTHAGISGKGGLP